MKKIGQISDSALYKRAEASGRPEAKNAVNSFIKAKIALLMHHIANAEVTGGAVLRADFKQNLLKTASSYFPAVWMRETEEVAHKRADALLVRIMEGALKKYPQEAIYDMKKTAELQLTRKKAADENINFVTPSDQTPPPAVDPLGLPLDAASAQDIVKQLIENTFDNLGVPGASPDPIVDQGIYDAGMLLDNLADVNAPASPTPDLSNPNSPVADEIEKMAHAFFTKLNTVADIIKKKAESGVAEAVPPTEPKNESAAQVTDAQTAATVETKPQLEGGVATPAGEDADFVAAKSELTKLLDPQGAEGTDQTNPVSSVNAVSSDQSEKKVAAADVGKHAAIGKSALGAYIARKVASRP